MKNNKHKDWFFYGVHCLALTIALAGLLLFIGMAFTPRAEGQDRRSYNLISHF